MTDADDALDAVDIVGYVMGESKLAFLFSSNGEDRCAVWLPKDKVMATEHHDDNLVTLTVPGWLAADRGLI